MTLSYEGTAYGGWQVQTNRNTVQAEVQQALFQVTGQQVNAVASGRTDAGVHALGQVVSFACETALAAEVLARALNANLPLDIVVLEVRDAPSGFHAIRDALRKRYRYVIQDGRLRDITTRGFAWRYPRRLDVQAMVEAAGRLLGEHDFSAFEAAGAPRADSIRTIYDLDVQRRPGDHLDRVFIEVEANGFLYNMVRNIVGSLVEVGRGKRSAGWLTEVLVGRNRKYAGATAPPEGLFLLKVWYEGDQ